MAKTSMLISFTLFVFVFTYAKKKKKKKKKKKMLLGDKAWMCILIIHCNWKIIEATLQENLFWGSITMSPRLTQTRLDNYRSWQYQTWVFRGELEP